MGLRNRWHAAAVIAVAAAMALGGCSDDGDATTADGTDDAAPVSLVGEPDGPTLGELVAGTSQVVDGTWVWTDYVYDDHGANTDAGDRTVLDDAGGDSIYPEGFENAADIVQVQLRPLEGST